VAHSVEGGRLAATRAADREERQGRFYSNADGCRSISAKRRNGNGCNGSSILASGVSTLSQCCSTAAAEVIACSI
jgi:hypothetical protein